MKILFVWVAKITNFGGTEKAVSIIISRLLNQGHEIRLLVFDNTLNETTKNDSDNWVEPFSTNKDKLYLFSLKENNRSVLPTYVKLFGRKLLKKNYTEGYDVIFNVVKEFMPEIIIVISNIHLITSVRKALQFLNIKQKSTIKIVEWDHSLFSTLYYNKSLKSKIRNYMYSTVLTSIVKKTDAFLVPSLEMKNKILSFDSEAKVYVIPNTLENYEGPLINQPIQNPLFLFVGRIDDRSKNISFLLKGLSHLLKRDWQLKIIGTGKDENKLKKLSLKLGLSDRIEWLGFRKDPYEEFKEVTALLLTSRFESFSMVLIEANQRGIPVISSDCKTGPSDIVIPGKNGYLFREGDMDDFVGILRDIIDKKLTFAPPEEIAKTAERFLTKKVVKNFIDALMEIKKNAKGRSC